MFANKIILLSNLFTFALKQKKICLYYKILIKVFEPLLYIIIYDITYMFQCLIQ